jgi:hypothetical protein
MIGLARACALYQLPRAPDRVRLSRSGVCVR